VSRVPAPSRVASRKLPPVNRTHLEAMSDETGIWQFASGIVPHRLHGYCTDDVARALVVDVLHGQSLGWAAVAGAVERDLTFLGEAYDAETGRFRNLRSATREWLPGTDSEDCHARALLGLGALLAWHPEPRTTVEAGTLFFNALPAADDFGELRPIAATILGASAAVEGGFHAAAATLDGLGERLVAAFEGLDPAWPWPVGTVTYENALLPRALIHVGDRSGDPQVTALGLRILDWLVAAQTSRGGHFSPVGNRGWWVRSGRKAPWDQQPIEPASTVLAALEAYRATGADQYEQMALRAFEWFLGENDLGLPVADLERGGCRDGLGPDGPSLNEGAESTLMWLTALEAMRRLRQD
jgi:hypothetical protein